MKIPKMVTMTLLGAVSDIAVSGKRSKNSNNSRTSKIKNPKKRMDALNQKAKLWLQQNIETAKQGDPDALVSFRKRAYKRILDNINVKTLKMYNIYSNTNDSTGVKRCGYFDPSTTYGGPQESPPKLNDNKKEARKDYLKEKNNEERGARHILENKLGIDSTSQERSIIHERTILAKIEDYSHIREHLEELEEWFRVNVDDYYLDELDINNIQDILDINSNVERHRRDSDKKGKGKKQRLEAGDPLKNWKTITTGYRKWAERYIAYCNKQYVERRFSRWAFEHLYKKVPMVYKKMEGNEE